MVSYEQERGCDRIRSLYLPGLPVDGVKTQQLVNDTKLESYPCSQAAQGIVVCQNRNPETIIGKVDDGRAEAWNRTGTLMSMDVRLGIMTGHRIPGSSRTHTLCPR